MKLTSTKTASIDHGVKILVHGPSGAGKTRLSATLPGRAVIFSAEAGLLSLRGSDIDVITINGIDDLRAAIGWLREHPEYEWVVVDSLSEIAEQVLGEELKKTPDGRKAYGELSAIMMRVFRALRDLDRNVYMTCKTDKTEVDGRIMWAPSMPGRQLSQSITYMFDEVFFLRVTTAEDGSIVRMLQTQTDGYHDAKDRSGALEQFEPADLKQITNKIHPQAHQEAK